MSDQGQKLLFMTNDQADFKSHLVEFETALIALDL